MDGLAFILKHLETTDGYHRFGLEGYRDDYAYGLTLEVTETLEEGAMFQGEDKLRLVPAKGTENFLRAMAETFSLTKPKAPMSEPYSAFDTILRTGSTATLVSGLTELKVPVGDAGAELVIVIRREDDSDVVTMYPRTDEQGVVDALAGGTS